MTHLRYAILSRYVFLLPDKPCWETPLLQEQPHTYAMQHLRYDESQLFHPVHNRCTLSGPDRTYSPNGLWLCKGIARRHCSCQFFHHGRRCRVLPKFNFRPSVAPNPSSASNRLTPAAPTKSVKAFTSRITRNKIMHALNGNIIWFERRTPPPRNYLWRQSFYIPNGMCIFRFSFYSKDSLWLYAHRRGSSFEIETTRRESPTLYGIVCRAVASRGGGPGDRWQLVQSHKRMWREGLSDPTTYGTNHLRYEDRPSGYQHREAHGGTQRGMRSFASNQRRLQSWKDARREGRKDYRIWKSSIRDSTLRVHGGQNPTPPIHPKPTYVERFFKASRSVPPSSQTVQLHKHRFASSKCTIPIPTNTGLHVLSWNVEGLRETSKCDQILSFCNNHNVSLLCAQETKAESSHTFCKSGWEILMSGLPSDKHHGVGFFVSPKLRSHVSDFIPHSPRIAEITVNTLPHKITIINVYAPSQVEDPEQDRNRKADFWTQLDEIMLSHNNSSHLCLVGDLNARLDSQLDPTSDYIGPAVIGRRSSLQDDDRDNAVYLLDFLSANNLSLPQTFSDLPFRKKSPIRK